MELTSNQFEILVYLDNNKGDKCSQRILATELDISLGVVNKVLSELIERKLLLNVSSSKYEVTDEGYKTLEQYKVKRAVFLAAGFGSRLVPITLNTPKPLIMVHGKKIIETLLDAVVAAGINEIYIVRGYLGEQFSILKEKYPTIQFIENKIYNEANNISSALLVKDLLENAYVLESDLYLYNPKLIRKYEYTTNYLGRTVEFTDDWCFKTKKGYISELKVGGKKVDHMYGISYWNSIDGKKMATDIEKLFNMPGGKERYWDEVALREFISNYQVRVKQCKESDIIEIDTFNELKQIDPIYNV